MIDFLSNLDNWALWLAAVVAGLSALGWLAKKARAGVKRIATTADRVETMFQLADHELRNNGGKTLKDQSDRTAAAVDTMAGVVDTLTETVDGIRETVDGVAEKVERVQSVEAKLDGHLQWSQTETERRVAEEQRLWTAIEAMRLAPDDN